MHLNICTVTQHASKNAHLFFLLFVCLFHYKENLPKKQRTLTGTVSYSGSIDEYNCNGDVTACWIAYVEYSHNTTLCNTKNPSVIAYVLAYCGSDGMGGYYRYMCNGTDQIVRENHSFVVLSYFFDIILMLLLLFLFFVFFFFCIAILRKTQTNKKTQQLQLAMMQILQLRQSQPIINAQITIILGYYNAVLKVLLVLTL